MRENWEKEGEAGNLAFGDYDLMGWAEEGGGRGQPFQPHVQQPRPPGEDCQGHRLLVDIANFAWYMSNFT